MDAISKEHRVKRAAKQLVMRFGADAAKQADRRMLELEMRHKVKSARLWRRIGDAVRAELELPEAD